MLRLKLIHIRKGRYVASDEFFIVQISISTRVMIPYTIQFPLQLLVLESPSFAKLFEECILHTVQSLI